MIKAYPRRARACASDVQVKVALTRARISHVKSQNVSKLCRLSLDCDDEVVITWGTMKGKY